MADCVVPRRFANSAWERLASFRARISASITEYSESASCIAYAESPDSAIQRFFTSSLNPQSCADQARWSRSSPTGEKIAHAGTAAILRSPHRPRHPTFRLSIVPKAYSLSAIIFQRVSHGFMATDLLRCAEILADRRAGADQVAVARDIVDARDRRPVFRRRRRIASRDRPLPAANRGGAIPPASASAAVCGALTSGLSSLGHSPFSMRAASPAIEIIAVAEPVKLMLRLGFGRLDHQRSRHRPRHGRRVETVVDQTLGDILDADAGAFLQDARVQDALMRDASVAALEQHREMRAESSPRYSWR